MRLDEFYNPEKDKSAQRKLGDTRRHMLSLKKLNKLRRYRELKKMEMAERAEFVKVMYRSPQAGGI